MATLQVQVIPGYQFTVGEIVTQAKLNAAATPTVNIVGTISTQAIANGSITTAKLALQAVTAATIANQTITATQIANATITATQIANATITTTQIAAGTITGSNIAASTITPSNLTGVAAVPTGVSRNLVVAKNAGTPNSKMTATADAVVLAGGGLTFQATSVNVTADITVNGANGLDTGAVGASTWYYLFVIYNPSGPTVASLLSLSKTAPTLPANYTYAALVGAVFTDGSSHFSHVITYGAVTKFISSPQNYVENAAVSLAHNLGRLPDDAKWFLLCNTAEAGYAQNDMVPLNWVMNGSNLNINTTGFNSTNAFTFSLNQTPDLYHKTTGALTGLALTGSTLTNWQLVCVATLI